MDLNDAEYEKENKIFNNFYYYCEKQLFHNRVK
jgi:hypothetical protein